MQLMNLDRGACRMKGDIRNSVVDNVGRSDYHSGILGLEGEADDRLLTVQEVCGLLKVSKAYIYSLTCRKKIPHIKMMGRLRFRQSDIDGWLQEQEVRSGNTET